ncbi:hypothetical protein OSTOST_16102 [Ostertagia ostertagi]
MVIDEMLKIVVAKFKFITEVISGDGKPSTSVSCPVGTFCTKATAAQTLQQALRFAAATRICATHRPLSL